MQNEEKRFNRHGFSLFILTIHRLRGPSYQAPAAGEDTAFFGGFGEVFFSGGVFCGGPLSKCNKLQCLCGVGTWGALWGDDGLTLYI